MHGEVSQRCSVASEQQRVHRGPALTCPATVSLINNSTDDSWLLLRCTVNDAMDIKHLEMLCAAIFESSKHYFVHLKQPKPSVCLNSESYRSFP